MAKEDKKQTRNKEKQKQININANNTKQKKKENTYGGVMVQGRARPLWERLKLLA